MPKCLPTTSQEGTERLPKLVCRVLVPYNAKNPPVKIDVICGVADPNSVGSNLDTTFNFDSDPGPIFAQFS